MYENLLANVPTDLWIGGKWRKASDGGRFDVIDPATERKIASVASATVDDAKAALDAAEGAFEGWAGRKPRERAEILRKAYDLIMRDAERFAKLITLENGKALPDSRGEVAYAGRVLPLVCGGSRAQYRRGSRVRRLQAREFSCTTSRPVSPCW
jgi:succinate-semialdehyde dehydrogenase/glutarate-semialdehyde dehydrogenase